MFRVLEIDQVSSFKPEDPDPLELTFISGVIVLFDTGINASPATDAPGEIEAIAPEGIREGFPNADLKFLPIFLEVSLFELFDEAFLFFLRHLQKMFLQEVFGFFLGARREERKRNAR
jgi:hypothetical protein